MNDESSLFDDIPESLLDLFDALLDLFHFELTGIDESFNE